jgi:uncharacterized repeat protein (TIGR01451 family)
MPERTADRVIGAPTSGPTGSPAALRLVLAALAGLGGALACPVALQAGNAASVPVGDLSNGQAVTIEIVVTVVDPVEAGVDLLATQGTVNGDNFPNVLTDDPGAGGAADPTVTFLDAEPELGIVKSYGGVIPVPGDTVAFDLALANDGNQEATGVTLVETVPADTSFNAAASTPGWSCSDGSPAGTSCNLGLGALAGGGAGGSAVFAVDLDDPLPPGTGTIVNTASIDDDGANGIDPDPSDNSDSETILLDTEAPTVVAVDTVPTTADGALTECETVTAGVDRLVVSFSEAMRDPPGDGDPDDVTHAANYLVVTAGPDLTYDTVACGGAAGDDALVPVSGVTYDTPTHVATVQLAGRLGSGLHRLLVCGSTTLRDTTGNPLDGDGDGTGGDDFVLSFRLDPGNRFANGHFDCGTSGWTPMSSGGAVQGFDPLTDAEASPESGSATASLARPGVGFAAASLGQCVVLQEGRLDLAGKARLDGDGSPLPFPIRLHLACEYHPAPVCGGGPLGMESHATGVPDTAGLFVAVGAELMAPMGTESGFCTATWQAPAGTTFEAWLDDLTALSTIFADGFESGDTSAWSMTVP